ncbi:hypothetical protein D3C75_501830 [compost metagenome]
MACAFSIVFRLLHRAQHHRADHRLFLRTLNLLQQVLQGTRMNRVAPAFDMIAKVSGKRHKVLQLLLIRVLVNPVQERNLKPVEMLGNRLIGSQHEFLNNLLSYRTLSLNNIDRLTVLIHNNFALFKIKINRSAPHPRPAQLHSQLFHQAEVLNQRTITLQQLRILILNDFADIGIGHSFFGPDYARKDIMLHDLHMLVKLHLTGHGEPVHFRIKTADPVRQPVRQHWNNPVYQIDAASTVIRFLVQLRVFTHIVANVSNMNAQLVVTVLQALHINRIIKVLGICAVNGYNIQPAQITPPLLNDLLIRNRIRSLLRFPHHLSREGLRQLMLADDRQNINSRIILMPENLNNLSLSRCPAFRVVHDAHYNLFTVNGSAK